MVAINNLKELIESEENSIEYDDGYDPLVSEIPSNMMLNKTSQSSSFKSFRTREITKIQDHHPIKQSKEGNS